MKDMEINTAGDLVLNDQDILLIESDQEITQSVKIIVATRLTEFLLDKEMGLSHDNLLGKSFHFDYLKQDITDAILTQEQRVTSIELITMSKEADRQLRINILMKVSGDEIETEVLLNA